MPVSCCKTARRAPIEPWPTRKVRGMRRIVYSVFISALRTGGIKRANMKVCIYGAGSIGGIIGTHLARMKGVEVLALLKLRATRFPSTA